jgi:hypothetical protein
MFIKIESTWRCFSSPTLKMAQRYFPDLVHVEADFVKFLMIQAVPAIKDKGGLHHACVNLLVIQRLILRPVGHHGQGVCTFGGFIGIGLITDLLAEIRKVFPGTARRVTSPHSTICEVVRFPSLQVSNL